jgi:thymidylate kinase
LDAGEYKKIASEGKYFSHQSKKRILFKRPVFTLTNVLDFLWEKIARIIFNLKKYNFLITVPAPDGTGKTTFIKTLSEELGFYYVCAAKDLVQINHFRPCMLPNLGAAGEKVGVMKEDKDFENPHRAKPAGGLSSFVRMTYYWLDYVIGVPMILRKNAQFSKVTIFDRYIYDFLVDPRRTRISLPYWIRRLFTKMVKQPKLVFVLNTTADIIYQRKQELTKEEIERQLKEYKKLGIVSKNVVFLDAAKAPEEIAKDAMRHIANTFMKKI